MKDGVGHACAPIQVCQLICIIKWKQQGDAHVCFYNINLMMFMVDQLTLSHVGDKFCGGVF